MDKAGNVYIADTDNFRVQMFSSKGAFKKAFAFVTSESVQDVAAGPDGSVWASALQASEVRKLGGDETLSTGPRGHRRRSGSRRERLRRLERRDVHNVIRFDKTESGFVKAKTLGGFQEPGDVEVSKEVRCTRSTG